jgi:TatD DNase family protein
MIDSHAHLGEEVYDADRGEVLARAAAAGVEAVVVIGYDAASSRRAIELAASADCVENGAGAGGVALYATAGIAPHHVAEADAAALADVRALLDDGEIVAVGEIGLDYHYDMPREAQRRLFARQLEWALELDLPVVIHSREAEDDVIRMLREHGAGDPRAAAAARARARANVPPVAATPRGGFHGAERAPERAEPVAVASPAPAGAEGQAARPLHGVIHCFTEGPAMAEAAVELGFYVSFAGIITFKSAGELRETAARVPLERTLIETDSPYLAPVPYRGKRNEPAWVVEVARALAGLHGATVEDVARVAAANARALFRL